jgi:hypothetical protein
MPRKATEGTKRKRGPRMPPTHVRRMTPLERQLSDDVDWAGTAPEVQQHHGKLVVVHKKQVLAVGDDRDALLTRAARKAGCGRSELAVVCVPSPGLWELPR